MNTTDTEPSEVTTWDPGLTETSIAVVYDDEFGPTAVVGVDDDQCGQRLVAFVVLTDGASRDDLKAHVRENLANYKVPRKITVLEGLPRGSTGKILRREVQEIHANDGDGS